MRRHYWILEDAIALIRSIDVDINDAGFAIGLTGSVLHNGCSEHDLDLIIYPRNSSEVSYSKLTAALIKLGWTIDIERPYVLKSWFSKGSTDDKHVEVWRTPDDKRVDLFLLH